MNIFKRSLSALLVLVMLVTAVPMGAIAVSAETTNGEYIYLDTPAQAVIGNEHDVAVMYFVPEATGLYTFASDTSYDVHCYVYDSNEVCIAEDDDSGEGLNFSVTVSLNAGETYELRSSFWSSDTGEFTVTVTEFGIESVYCEPVTIIENCNGQMITTTTEDGETVEYYSYDDVYPEFCTVTMKDGTVYEIRTNGGFEHNGTTYYFANRYGQNYEDRFVPGSNTAYFSINNVEYTFEVNVVESPIVDIICDSKVTIIENTNGYYKYDESYSDENGWEYSPEYYYYYPHPKTLVAILEDGTEYDLVETNYSFYWNGFYYYCGVFTDQSYENQWGEGTYPATLSVGGYSISYDVEILSSPVASVDVKPIKVIENTHGSISTDEVYDEVSGGFKMYEYFRYDTPYPEAYTITLIDGSVYENNGFDWEGEWYDVDRHPIPQDYNNTLGLGTYYVDAYIEGYEFTYEFEIIEAPKIELNVPVTVSRDVYGQFVPFKFVPEVSGTYMFYSEGSDGSYCEILDENGELLNRSGYNGSSYNDFKAGCYLEAGREYTLYITNSNRTYVDYTVFLEMSPVVSVVAEDVYIIENTNCYEEEVWADDDWKSYVKYNNFNPINYTVTMKDGTVIEVRDNSVFEWNGEEFCLSSYTSDQSYENQWGIGTHTALGSISGCEFTYNVVIAESPVESVNVGKILVSMNSDSAGYYTCDETWDEETGNWESSPEYFYYWAPYLSNASIVLSDGTVIEDAENGFRWNGRWYGLDKFEIEQSYDNQLGVGVHTGEASIANYEFSYEFEIVDEIVSSVYVAPVVLYKNSNGYYCTEYVWDEETQTENYVSYFYYELPWPTDYTITLVDGSQYHNEGFSVGHDWYDISIMYPEQTYDSPLTVGVHTVTGYVGNFEFTFELEIRDLPEIFMDSPIVIDPSVDGIKKSFKFVPEKTDNYVISSLDSINDPMCYIYDDKGEQIAFDDDGGENMNFSVACRMEAGREYTVLFNSRDTDCAPYTVLVEGSPIVSVVVDDIVLVEKTGGHWSTHTTDDGGIAEYYYYSSISPRRFTVTMRDGSVVNVEDSSSFEWNGKWYDMSTWTNQGYYEQWGVGANTVYASLGGYEFTYNVIIEESPVVSIVAETRTIIQHTNGYFTNESYYDEETGEWVNVEYFHYWTPYPDKYTITLKDGAVYENNGFEWKGNWYSIEADSLGQSYDNQLGIGTHRVSAIICGYEFEYSFEIIDTPIASVEAEPVLKLQYSDGYYRTDEYWDEETDEYIRTPEYYYYYTSSPRNYKITMKDGTVFENESVCWNGEYYGFSMNTFLVNGEPQSYDNQAGIGVYPVEASILGYQFTFNIEIIDTPIESIEISNIQIAENTQGYFNTDWYWNEDTQQEEQTPEYFYYYEHAIKPYNAVITLKDGTVHRGNGFVLNGQYYSFTIDYEQSYENRLLPGLTEIDYSIAGYKSSYTVEISSVASNDSFEYMITTAGVIITDCYLNCETIEIPSTIEGKPVIGVDGFNGDYRDVRHFIIPDNVKTLGDYVLPMMSNLETVEFGAGLRNLNCEMLAYNNNLKSISVSEDNENYTVVNGVLYNKDVTTFIALPVGSVDSLVVPKTCVDIEGIYYNIYSNIEISFEDGHAYFVTVDGVTYDKEMTRVQFCSKNYQGEYVMPDSVTEINALAFNGVDGLTSVVISDQVTEIVYAAFASCRNLKSVELPEGLVSIQMYAFRDTPALEGIDLPESLLDIGNGAFELSGITSIKIPDSCEYISYKAFKNSAVKTVDLGEGVVEIGSSAFENTPVESVVVPDSVTVLGYSAFMNCRELKSVELGSGLDSISSETFMNTSIGSIVFPENIQYVGSRAFAYSSLESLEFKNPAIQLGNYVFYNCPIKELVLGNEMTDISEGAFAGTDIKVLDIPDSVTRIVYQAFMGCEDLSEINIPENIIKIGGHTFDNTAWYNDHADGLMYLDHALYSWKGAMPENTSIVLKDGTTIIADYAFQHQENITSITLPESLEIIGDYAFYGCKGIKELHIPANVHMIGEGVFNGCMSLKNITVDPDNEHYYVEDGVLYDASGYEIYDTNVEYMVTNVWVFSGPEKYSYNVGEELDLTGLRMRINYTNDYGEFVTEDFEKYGIEFAGFDSSAAGECRVDIIYNGEIYDWFWVDIVGDNDETEQYWEIPVFAEGEHLDCSSVTFTVDYNFEAVNVVEVFGDVEISVDYIADDMFTVTVYAEQLRDLIEGDMLFVIIIMTYEDFGSVEEIPLGIRYTCETDDTPSDVVSGDVNGDADVNAKDANLIKRIIAGALEIEAGSDAFNAADINGDGEINAKDANLIKRIIAGAI